mgnify:FL=1
MYISKHLMLKFIGYGYMATIRNYRISKHLMLKFIGKEHDTRVELTHFKTSHVKVYHDPQAIRNMEE